MRNASGMDLKMSVVTASLAFVLSAGERHWAVLFKYKHNPIYLLAGFLWNELQRVRAEAGKPARRYRNKPGKEYWLLDRPDPYAKI